jgi:hypothetical protein
MLKNDNINININSNFDSEDQLDNKISKINNSESIIYNYNTSSIDESVPSVYKEILRYININGLKECFQMKLKELVSDKYDINELFKNNSCKLIELINRWCWHQYNNPTSIDNVIPYVTNELYDYDRFIDDLNYILNIHDKEYAIKLDNEIIIGLKKIVSDYLCIQYNDYSQRKDLNIAISKDVFDRKIRLSCSYKKNTYQIVIHYKVYNRLKVKLIIFGKKYKILESVQTDLDNLLDQYIFCLVFRYSYMDSGNQQLSINKYIKDLFKNCGVNFELFGSAINTISTHYCSLYYDIEKYFGSNGDFFNIQIQSGIYWCNPPYDDTIMKNTVNKLINILETTTEVAFLVTIPIWDEYTQNKLKDNQFDNVIRNLNINSKSEDHVDFLIYSKLKPYIKDELIIPKHRIPYFNYKKYSNINAVNTYMLIIYKSINQQIAKNLHMNFDKIIDLDKENFFL